MPASSVFVLGKRTQRKDDVLDLLLNKNEDINSEVALLTDYKRKKQAN